MQGHTGSTRSIRRQKEPGEHTGTSLYCGFAGKARQGQVNSLGLASLNNSSRLWATYGPWLSHSWHWGDLG